MSGGFFHFKQLRRMAAVSTLFVLVACGGSGGGDTANPTAVLGSYEVAPAPVQNGSTTASKALSIETIKSGSATDPLAIIRSPKGSTIAYFGDATGSSLTQAQFKSPDGIAQTVYFDADGLINKVVDGNNGNFLIIHPRSDGTGTEYVVFDITGKFIGGGAIFARNGVWNSARIIGLPANAGTVNYGAAVYGPSTPVSGNLSNLLNPAGQPVAMNQNPVIRLLNRLIPSAQAFTSAEKSNLKSGAKKMAAGFIFWEIPPVGIALMIAGAVDILEGLAGQADRGLDTFVAVTDNLMTGKTVNKMYEDKDFLESGRAVIEDTERGYTPPAPENIDTFISRTEIEASKVREIPKYKEIDPTPELNIPTSTITSSMPVPVLSAIVISGVTPETAIIKQPINIVVTGSNLGGWKEISVQLDGCTGMQSRGGTDTTKTFTCTPGLNGLRAGTVSDTKTSAKLNTFYVKVNDDSAAANAPTTAGATATAGTTAPAVSTTPVIDDISPATAILNQSTTFTVTGRNLINGMRFQMEGCSGTEVMGMGTSTMRQFTCSSALSGTNIGTIKDKLDGTVLRTFSVAVGAIPPPPVAESGLICVEQPSTSRIFYGTATIEKFCYYLSVKGSKVFQGLYEVFDLKSKQLLESRTWVDGKLSGRERVYYFDRSSPGNATIDRTTARLYEEGDWLNGEKVGTWNYYFTDIFDGVDGFGKISNQITWGVFNGRTVEAETRVYCSYNQYVIPVKKGQLQTIYRTDLKTGVGSIVRVLKNGCERSE
jgi:hypothetical protein